MRKNDKKERTVTLMWRGPDGGWQAWVHVSGRRDKPWTMHAGDDGRGGLMRGRGDGLGY